MEPVPLGQLVQGSAGEWCGTVPAFLLVSRLTVNRDVAECSLLLILCPGRSRCSVSNCCHLESQGRQWLHRAKVRGELDR
jgi:hypothetical protein